MNSQAGPARPWPPARAGTASTRRNSRVRACPRLPAQAGRWFGYAERRCYRNGEVHQRVVENMSDDRGERQRVHADPAHLLDRLGDVGRGERLSPVNVRKAVVAGKAGRREPQRGRQSEES